MRKIIHIFLSLVIVFGTTLSAYAASPAGWTVQSATTYGSSTIINAIKNTSSGALASTVEYIAPAGNVAKEIIKIGGGVAAIYAISQLIGAGVDWVLDPANNTVKYKTALPHDGTNEFSFKAGDFTGSSASVVANQYCQSIGKGSFVNFAEPPNFNVPTSIVGRVGIFYINCTQGLYGSIQSTDTGLPSGVKYEDKTIPISTVAAKVVANAEAGHAPSQALIKTVAIADANNGAVDARLDDAAVPYDPANPNDPNNPAIPFDPSSILAAIASLKSIVDNGFSTMRAKMETFATDLGLIDAKIDTLSADVADTKRVINDGMADVVAANNATGAKVGDVVAAIEALEGNMLTGEVINAAVDEVIAAGHTDTASIVAAIEAIEGNTLDGQVINDAVDRVLTNDDANAKATQDVVSDSIDKSIEAGQADATKVADAVDAQTDAITTTDPTTGQKSLSLPSFCSWASPVCTFIDWSKQQWLEFTLTFTALKDWLFEDAPPNDKDNTIDTPVLPVTPVQVAIDFVGSCPAPLTFEYKIYNQTFKPSVPFTPMCEVAIMINPVIKICATIAAIFIIAGIRQGNS
ncbi:virulence factor TspB C-terminal domain-related protein [Psychrobacter sp. D2]|uniref:virulence factor TspB C-terminal domain-related protein n=1 Tax=Psychrobacter sp. D2 TaxID=2759702 RepID=UPI0015E61E6F|nr:virulence factor TspB C-terminal domain-related protein [Psychrobacter sp. D2]